jgi:hypothetical protein
MVTIAGGIVLGLFAFIALFRLGLDAEGEFSFAVLFGKALAVVLLLALLAIVAVVVYKLSKSDLSSLFAESKDGKASPTEWIAVVGLAVLGLWVAKVKQLW